MDIINNIDASLVVNNDLFTNIKISLSEDKIKEISDYAILQSIEIIRRRVDEVGTNEPIIQRQGKDRILVQLPGLDDPERIKRLLGKTARMNFRMVNETSSLEEALSGKVPPGSDLLFELDSTTGEKTIPYLIYKKIGVSGDQLVDANPTMDNYNQPVVSLRFDSAGSRKFGDLTSKNVGKRFAIVLDGEVISAPVIREAITGGSGQISGNFTFESASDLAVLLRAGALPAPLTILEERSVGPSLGKDSINSGIYAAIIAVILVVFYMIIIYGTRLV
jgi:protein-export membrane protein SecD